MIFNLTKKKLIAANPVFFRGGWFTVFKIFGNDFNKNDAVVFQNKGYLFAFMLNLNVDYIFTDIENRACKIINCGYKRKLYVGSFKASHIICLSGGMVNKLNIENGDKFNLNIELSTEFKKKLEKRISETVVSSPGIMTEKQ